MSRLQVKSGEVCINLLQCFVFSGESAGSSILTFQKGDLLVLQGQETGQSVMSNGWCQGECARTQKVGAFPAECVYILPTVTKPPADILVGSSLLYFEYHIKILRCFLKLNYFQQQI